MVKVMSRDEVLEHTTVAGGVAVVAVAAGACNVMKTLQRKRTIRTSLQHIA